MDVIYVSDDDQGDDEVISVSDDASVVSDSSEDDTDAHMQDDGQPGGPLHLEIRSVEGTQQFILPLGADLPMCFRYDREIVAVASILATSRESLTTMCAQAQWDAAFLAHLLLGRPVPDAQTNLHVFINECACLKVHAEPTFSITLK